MKMNRMVFLILMILLLSQGISFASVATSDSYSLTLGIMDVGGGIDDRYGVVKGWIKC